MPERSTWNTYVEPFAGGLAVLLANDPEGVSEVVNDLDRELINFWRVLQNPRQFKQMYRRLQATPFSEVEWQDSRRIVDCDDVEAAAKFFVRVRQSLAGRQIEFAPSCAGRTRRGMNEQTSTWLSAVEGLPGVHCRLSRVAIFNRDALQVIRGQDNSRTLFYCDPPYVTGTRVRQNVYAKEMSDVDRAGLLDVLLTVEGKVMLSGYRNDLYDARLSHWRRVEWDVALHSSGGPVKGRRTECLWLNY